MQPCGDDAESRRRHRLEGVDELSLGRGNRALEQHAPGRGEGQLGAAAVIIGAGTPNETAPDETRDDDRHRALMRERAIGELVDGKRRRLGESLEHEELRRAQLPALLGQPVRVVQRAYDAAQPIDHLGDVVPMLVRAPIRHAPLPG